MADLKKTVWGPSTWKLLHTIAATTDNPPAFVQLLRMLPVTLPCLECRQHCSEYFSSNPPESSVRDIESASIYVWEFHNAVNTRLGKPLADGRLLRHRYNVVLPDSLALVSRYERCRPYRRI